MRCILNTPMGYDSDPYEFTVTIGLNNCSTLQYNSEVLDSMSFEIADGATPVTSSPFPSYTYDI